MGRKALRMDLNILKEAANAIESHQDYGDPETNHRRIADLWNIYAGTMLNSKDVMMMMILVILIYHLQMDQFVVKTI